MNDHELSVKVISSMYTQIKNTGVAIPAQVLMDVGVLSKQDHENWRFGKVDYLERVCKIGLSKLSFIMKTVRKYARENNLKASEAFYKRWGMKDKRKTTKLRFSKTGDENIDKGYATHYVDSKRINEIKEEKVLKTEIA